MCKALGLMNKAFLYYIEARLFSVFVFQHTPSGMHEMESHFILFFPFIFLNPFGNITKSFLLVFSLPFMRKKYVGEGQFGPHLVVLMDQPCFCV